jgi:hypothetical protein
LRYRGFSLQGLIVSLFVQQPTIKIADRRQLLPGIDAASVIKG